MTLLTSRHMNSTLTTQTYINEIDTVLLSTYPEFSPNLACATSNNITHLQHSIISLNGFPRGASPPRIATKKCQHISKCSNGRTQTGLTLETEISVMNPLPTEAKIKKWFELHCTVFKSRWRGALSTLPQAKDTIY